MDQGYIQYIRSFVGKAKVIMVVSGAIVIDKADRVLLQKDRTMDTGDFPVGIWRWEKPLRRQHKENYMKKQV